MLLSRRRPAAVWPVCLQAGFVFASDDRCSRYGHLTTGQSSHSLTRSRAHAGGSRGLLYGVVRSYGQFQRLDVLSRRGRAGGDDSWYAQESDVVVGFGFVSSVGW